jgi:hypothetical protein
LFNPDPKYKSQVLAKTSQDVAQQGENKGRWKELTEQADSPDFSFFLNFPGIFQNALVGINFFYFFTIFLYFSLNKDKKKMQPQKLTPTTEVGCGLQKYSTFYEKHAKTLTIFFFIFQNFFGNFDETKQGKAKVVNQSIVERG